MNKKTLEIIARATGILFLLGALGYFVFLRMPSHGTSAEPVSISEPTSTSTPTPTPSARVLLGLNPINYIDGPNIGDLEGARQMGASIVRLWVYWGRIEAKPGQYDWAALDEMVKISLGKGLEPWVLVAGVPAHACRDTNFIPAELDNLCPPELGAYQTFLSKLATRYRGQVRYYEIWNEPDDKYYWATGPSAAKYAELLLLSYKTIKTIDPDAQVVMAATAGTNLPFTAKVLARLNGQPAFDATASHPYRWSDATSYLTAGPGDLHTITLADGSSVQVNFKDELLLYQQVFYDNGYGWPDLWITEFGWPAHDDVGNQSYVTLAQQADYLRQTYALLHDDPELSFVRGLIWFADRDWATDPNDPVAQNEFGFFGLAWADDKWKPAATVFAQLSSAHGTKSASSSSDFFPIGLYGADDLNDFPEIAKAGFTLVHSYHFENYYDEGVDPWGRTDKQAVEYLDAAQKAGLRVIMGVPSVAVQDMKTYNNQNLAIIEQRVRAIKAHPSLWAYILYDEPENQGYGREFTVNPENFGKAYKAIKALDTVHPVLTTPAGDIDDTYPYLDIDMMMLQYMMLPAGIYDYPWDKLENLREAHRSSCEILTSKRMPFLWTIQAYNIANDTEMWPEIKERNPSAVGRFPTREEMRFMAYGGIILGAKGIIFVSQYEDISPEENPKQWQAVSSVTTELKTLSPILLAPHSQVRVTATPANAETEFLLKEYQEKLYLIALNPKEQKRTIKFTFSKSLTAVKVLNESRTILTQDNSFTDDFAGYGVNVYEVTTTGK